MTVLAIAGASVRRLLRDRTALFFLVILPVVVIVIVGATVRGFSTWKVGVVDPGAGAAGRQLVAALDRSPDLVVSHYTDPRSMSTAIARGELSTGVVLPPGMTATERAGRPAVVQVVVEHADTAMQAAATAVAAVVRDEGGRVQAAQFATAQSGGTFAANRALAAGLEQRLPRVAVHTTQAQASASILPEGFSYSAPTQLVLFVFLSAVAGGAAIIEARRLGLYERISAAPVRPGGIIAGEAVTYFAIAIGQSLLIVVVGAVAFGVSWGDPPAAALLLALWALVGAGAGMLAGTLFATPEQATAIGPVVGIGFGMLGGCMWPLAIVSPFMRQLGHATPHAWAVDAWTALLARGGTVATILPDLAVLAGFAVVFLVLATRRLARVLA